MEFNLLEYTNAMESFLLAMEKISTYNYLQINEAVSDLCKVLRIGQITVASKGKNAGIPYTIYGVEEVDTHRSLVIDENDAGNNIVEYQIYQFKDDPDWTEVELSKIQILEKMLFVYKSRIRAREMEDYNATHDKGLELYNLHYFFMYCKKLIKEQKIGEYAACHFNLKGFSTINQMIGRDNGTKVMKLYVDMLSDIIGSDGLICRVGGDNFAALFKKDKTQEFLKPLSGVEIVWNEETGEKVYVVSSAGVYSIDDPSKIKEESDIIDNTMVASNMARNVLKCPVVYYDDHLTEQLRETKRLEGMFSEAIEKEEFKVFYQPKVTLKDYKLAGAEALCRWIHDGEMMSPAKFIPVFEQSNMICTLDFYMLEHVCQDIRKWMDEGKKIVKVSVNLSRLHLSNIDLLDTIISIIDKYEVPHKYIEIELTETTTDVDFTDLKRVVCGLQKAGISTSVDDFGIGYSSLNLIRELPWNVLKLDKSFLSENGRSQAQNRSMLKHVISMAQDMGMECIVEGVEELEQVKLLKENNCFLAQGFYFDRPMPKDDFERRLAIV